MHIFGAPVTIVPDEAKKEDGKNKLGYFLGFLSTSAVVLYQDIDTKSFSRARHGRIDNFLCFH